MRESVNLGCVYRIKNTQTYTHSHTLADAAVVPSAGVPISVVYGPGPAGGGAPRAAGASPSPGRRHPRPPRL